MIYHPALSAVGGPQEPDVRAVGAAAGSQLGGAAGGAAAGTSDHIQAAVDQRRGASGGGSLRASITFIPEAGTANGKKQDFHLVKKTRTKFSIL